MRVHSFESMAAVDGEGVRFAVFLTGCPLRCVYCHNPDTWTAQGTEYTAEQLYRKIRRYKPYFGTKGGVTFSGGEPLLHADEINELAALLKADGIGYALDTSGCVELTEAVKQAVENADMIICDLKFWDNENYLKYTGRDMTRTLDFLEYCNNLGKHILARTVIVPTINDTAEHIAKYCAIISRFNSVFKYELLGFHTMGFFKYENLGIDNPLKRYEQMDVDKLAELQKEANRILGMQ